MLTSSGPVGRLSFGASASGYECAPKEMLMGPASILTPPPILIPI